MSEDPSLRTGTSSQCGALIAALVFEPLPAPNTTHHRHAAGVQGPLVAHRHQQPEWCRGRCPGLSPPWAPHPPKPPRPQPQPLTTGMPLACEDPSLRTVTSSWKRGPSPWAVSLRERLAEGVEATAPCMPRAPGCQTWAPMPNMGAKHGCPCHALSFVSRRTQVSAVRVEVPTARSWTHLAAHEQAHAGAHGLAAPTLPPMGRRTQVCMDLLHPPCRPWAGARECAWSCRTHLAVHEQAHVGASGRELELGQVALEHAVHVGRLLHLALRLLNVQARLLRDLRAGRGWGGGVPGPSARARRAQTCRLGARPQPPWDLNP